MAIDNRENLDTFVPASVADAVAAAFGRRKRRIDETLMLQLHDAIGRRHARRDIWYGRFPDFQCVGVFDDIRSR
jgi:hypothetical protein